MRFTHTHRPGFLLGFIDFFTAGIFFLVYMQLGLQEELESVLGHKVMPYWKAYLLGILLMGPAVATHRFFRTLNRVEGELNHRSKLTFSFIDERKTK